MKTLRINVKDKIATYFQRDGVIVCGNKGYKIVFTFDEEWDEYTTKTARFIWNGKFTDKKFEENECEVPVINDATHVTVGVYAGNLKTTTPAEIPCLISILCGNPEVAESQVKEYREIAQRAAAEAQKAAEEAKKAATAVVHPTIDVEKIEGGHKLIIHDADGDEFFNVMNGKNGGEDGKTPYIQDGFWYIDGESTGVKAEAEDGRGISDTEINDDGELVITYTDGDTKILGKVVGGGSGTVTIDEIDPSKVVFGETVYTGFTVGNIDKLVGGKAVLANKGENLLQVMKNIWSKEVNPTNSNITKPSVSITFNQAGSYEVGKVVTPTYSATFNKGKYPYDDDTGVTRTGSWSITDTAENSSTSSSGSFKVNDNKNYSFTVGDDTEYKITASTGYSDGIVPHSNMGNPYSAGQIKAGTASKSSSAVTGYRNSFYGVCTAWDVLTNGNIRGICEKLTASGKSLGEGDSFKISIPASTVDKPIYRVLIAYPDDLPKFESVTDRNDSNRNIATGFKLITDNDGNLLKIPGANSYDPIPYKVYVMDYGEPYNQDNVYTVTI